MYDTIHLSYCTINIKLWIEESKRTSGIFLIIRNSLKSHNTKVSQSLNDSHVFIFIMIIITFQVIACLGKLLLLYYWYIKLYTLRICGANSSPARKILLVLNFYSTSNSMCIFILSKFLKSRFYNGTIQFIIIISI